MTPYGQEAARCCLLPFCLTSLWSPFRSYSTIRASRRDHGPLHIVSFTRSVADSLHRSKMRLRGRRFQQCPPHIRIHAHAGVVQHTGCAAHAFAASYHRRTNKHATISVAQLSTCHELSTVRLRIQKTQSQNFSIHHQVLHALVCTAGCLARKPSVSNIQHQTALHGRLM